MFSARPGDSPSIRGCGDPEKEINRLKAEGAIGSIHTAVRKVRDIARERTREEKILRHEDRIRREDEAFKRKLMYERHLSQDRKKVRQRTKGMIAPRRGVYDEIVTQSADFRRLNLDPDSSPYGSGYFWEGHDAKSPGYFAKTLPSKTSKVPLVEPTLEDVKQGRIDSGPTLPGCGFVKYGEGSWPGEGRPGQEPRSVGDDQKWDSWTQAGATEDFARNERNKLRDK